MSEGYQPPAVNEEAALTELFAQRLVEEPLPAAVLDRLTLRVLDEVQHTLLSAQPNAAKPAARRRPRRVLERLRDWLGGLSPKQSLLLAGAAAAVAMLIFVGISRVTPRPLTATAAVSGGEATVLTAQTSRFRIQHDGDELKLHQGDQVLTANGSVHLAHFPDHITVIEPGAYVELTELDEADGGLQLALTVHDGLVHSTLGAPLRPNDRYTIRTPIVAVSAVGTEFSVEAVSDEETLVTTFVGTVAVTMEGQTVTVGPGEEVDAIAGHALAVRPASGD